LKAKTKKVRSTAKTNLKKEGVCRLWGPRGIEKGEGRPRKGGVGEKSSDWSRVISSIGKRKSRVKDRARRKVSLHLRRLSSKTPQKTERSL